MVKIRQIRAIGLGGATPEGGWSVELRPEDSVHTLVFVETDEGIGGIGRGGIVSSHCGGSGFVCVDFRPAHREHPRRRASLVQTPSRRPTQHPRYPRQLRQPQRPPQRVRQATTAQAIWNATYWCWVPGLAAIRPHFGRPTWAWRSCWSSVTPRLEAYA